MEFKDTLGIRKGMSYIQAYRRLTVRGWSPPDAFTILHFGVGKDLIRRRKKR